MEEQIIQLETLAALQDETIASLSQEIFRQQQDLGRLHRRLDTLEAKLEKLQDPEQIAENERPPHW